MERAPGLERVEEFLRCTSQTKPGPNMAAAVARRVERRVSREENERFIWLRRGSGIGVVSGDWRIRVQ